jgi:hypothetical protein
VKKQQQIQCSFRQNYLIMEHNQKQENICCESTLCNGFSDAMCGGGFHQLLSYFIYEALFYLRSLIFKITHLLADNPRSTYVIKSGVWWADSATRITRPIFFSNTITSKRWNAQVLTHYLTFK